MVRRKKEKEAIIDEALKRFDTAEEAWSEIYQCGLEDIRFVDSVDQWTDNLKAARKDRPCMTFDKLSGAIDQVVGDHLQNRPGVKVIAAEEDDQDTAEIYEGIIRQIESRSPAAYSTGFKFAVKGSIGFWKVRHDYLDPECFDQDIMLDEIKNPFSVLIDPIVQNAALEKMRYAFVFDDMPREDFEDKYPKASTAVSEHFRSTGNLHKWISDDTVRVADYYRLVQEDAEIGQTADGKVYFVDEQPDVEYVKTRKTKVNRLERFKITGLEVLDEVECVGRYIPIVPIFGKRSNIDGKMVVRGLVRKAKDAQTLYNLERSNYIESVALQPKQPYMVTPRMLEGHEERWRNLNTSNDPALFYNPDPEAPGGRPIREAAAQVPAGLIAGLQMSSDDIKSTTGIYDASLGQRSNETSGKAIMARQREGDTATYEFTDEFAQAIDYTGRIFINWIPQIYDAQRQIRILGDDESEEVMAVNKPELNYETGEYEIKNDLSRGKYDLRVRVGPSYTTRRIETAEQLSQVMAQNPEMGKLFGDIWLKSLDLVGGDEAVARMRKVLVKQGIADPTDEEKQELQQKAQSPQAQMKKQMQQMAMQLEMANKKAETAETQASTNAKNAKAQKDRMEALAKQMEIQIQQQDIQGLAQNYQRLVALLRGRM